MITINNAFKLNFSNLLSYRIKISYTLNNSLIFPFINENETDGTNYGNKCKNNARRILKAANIPRGEISKRETSTENIPRGEISCGELFIYL